MVNYTILHLPVKVNDPGSVNSTPQSMHYSDTPLSPVFAHSPHANSGNSDTCHGDTIAKVVRLLMVNELCQLCSSLWTSHRLFFKFG